MNPEIIRRWISALGGRRFLLTIGASGIHTLMFATTDRLSEQGYLTIFGATVGAYLISSTVQKVQEIRSA